MRIFCRRSNPNRFFWTWCAVCIAAAVTGYGKKTITTHNVILLKTNGNYLQFSAEQQRRCVSVRGVRNENGTLYTYTVSARTADRPIDRRRRRRRTRPEERQYTPTRGTFFALPRSAVPRNFTLGGGGEG